MKRLFSAWILALMATLACAQMMDPVKFTTSLKTGSGAEGELVFHGKIESGWHVYSTDLGSDGPIEASFTAEKLDGVELVGKLQPQGKELRQYDRMFGMELRFFEGSVTFVQKVRFTKPAYNINGYLTYGACSDQACLPPSDVTFKAHGKSPAVAGGDADAKTDKTGETATDNLKTDEADATDGAAAATDTTAGSDADSASALPALPQTDNLMTSGETDGSGSALWVFAMGFVGGLLALLTPCVWPIIPMTVSFFLKRAKDDRRKGIRDAVTYGLSIIVIYVTLGLAVTAIFGASKLNELSTSAVFNLFFFALLVVFALSFFGWFELQLPSKWGDAVDSKATATSGLVSIFLMAFTLSLVSFSCTGPVIGFLLVEVAAEGSTMGPAVGMLGFAIALALPFTLFAMFPSWLKSAPRSGSWMTTIKVVLGFIELAFSLKFLSVADLAYGWHILDREVFLSLWIVIFAMLGLYLTGMLKFQSDLTGGEVDKPKPVACIMAGMISLAFALYMVPGLWGAPCKAVSAFAPPMSTQDFNLYTKEVRAAYTDYEQGMQAARQQGKPVLIDFTGYGCVNCRKMEAAVWTDPRVADCLTQDYILISLYVDDKTPLPAAITVNENGTERTLRTVGDKWSYLQRTRFGANIQPFYVGLDADGRRLNGYFSYKEDADAFMEFLNKGLTTHRK